MSFEFKEGTIYIYRHGSPKYEAVEGKRPKRVWVKLTEKLNESEVKTRGQYSLKWIFRDSLLYCSMMILCLSKSCHILLFVIFISLKSVSFLSG